MFVQFGVLESVKVKRGNLLLLKYTLTAFRTAANINDSLAESAPTLV